MPETPPKRRWLKPIIALIIIAAFATWFIPWANRRMNTMPLPLDEAYAKYIPASEQEYDEETSKKLIDTCSYLDPQPTINVKQPAGMKWEKDLTGKSIHINDVNRGKWLPESRPHLKTCIQYLESQPLAGKLNELRKLHGNTWQWSFPCNPIFTSPYAELSPIYRLATTLTARARYQCAHLNNPAAAWEDLQTGLWLSETIGNNRFGSYLMSTGIQRSTFAEIIHLTREGRFDNNILLEINQAICDLPLLTSQWQTALNVEKNTVHAVLASCYANTGDGDGWLILSEGPVGYATHFYQAWGPTFAHRSRLWNLTTVCHKTHKQVERAVTSFFDTIADAVEASYDQGSAQLKPTKEITLLDGRYGPAQIILDQRYSQYYPSLYKSIASKRAARITLALHYYHSKHNAFPNTLPDEIRGWPGALPLDPFSGKPFKYRCEDGQKYDLWSVGTNLIDDNSTPQYDAFGNRLLNDEGDIAYSLGRKEPFHDTEPVPIDGNKPVTINSNGVNRD